MAGRSGIKRPLPPELQEQPTNIDGKRQKIQGSLFDMRDEQKRWLLVGIVLYNIISPVLKKHISTQTHKSHYTTFDEILDAINTAIGIFPRFVQLCTDKVRSQIHNRWGHYEFKEWTDTKYQESFKLIEILIRSLNLSNQEGNEIVHQLYNWNRIGKQFIDGTTDGFMVLKEIKLQIQDLVNLIDVPWLKKKISKEEKKYEILLDHFFRTGQVKKKDTPRNEGTDLTEIKAVYNVDAPVSMDIVENWSNLNVFQSNTHIQSMLHSAYGYDGNEEFVLLLEENTDMHYHERPYTEIVKPLFWKNADVSQRNRFQRSLLYRACEQGDTETVKFVLERNADVPRCDMFGQCPLNIACKNGYTEIVKLLLEGKADVSHRKTCRRSLLYHACEKGCTEIVKLLLEKNTDVSLCDRFGQCSLNIACKKGYTEIVKRLLEGKARVSHRKTCRRSLFYHPCEQV